MLETGVLLVLSGIVDDGDVCFKDACDILDSYYLLRGSGYKEGFFGP